MGVTDFLRKFDLYKKVPHDLTKGTISGAVISVICVAITGKRVPRLRLVK